MESGFLSFITHSLPSWVRFYLLRLLHCMPCHPAQKLACGYILLLHLKSMVYIVAYMMDHEQVRLDHKLLLVSSDEEPPVDVQALEKGNHFTASIRTISPIKPSVAKMINNQYLVHIGGKPRWGYEAVLHQLGFPTMSSLVGAIHSAGNVQLILQNLPGVPGSLFDPATNKTLDRSAQVSQSQNQHTMWPFHLPCTSHALRSLSGD